MRFQEIQPWCRPSNKLHAVTIIRLFESLHDDMDSITFVIPPYSFRHFRDPTRFRERRRLKPRRRCPVYPSESTGLVHAVFPMCTCPSPLDKSENWHHPPVQHGWMDENYCFLLDSSSLGNHGGQLSCRFQYLHW